MMTPRSRSPHGLLQEVFRVNPWLLLEASVLLNRTRGASLQAPMESMHRRWPEPGDLAKAVLEDLAVVLQPLGLQRRRAKALIELAGRWEGFRLTTAGRVPTSEEISPWPGVGPYALDSYRIFVDGIVDDDAPRSGDAKLRAYCHWARTGEVVPIETKRPGPKPKNGVGFALKLFEGLRDWKVPRTGGTMGDVTAEDVRKLATFAFSSDDDDAT